MSPYFVLSSKVLQPTDSVISRHYYMIGIMNRTWNSKNRKTSSENDTNKALITLSRFSSTVEKKKSCSLAFCTQLGQWIVIHQQNLHIYLRSLPSHRKYEKLQKVYTPLSQQCWARRQQWTQIGFCTFRIKSPLMLCWCDDVLKLSTCERLGAFEFLIINEVHKLNPMLKRSIFSSFSPKNCHEVSLCRVQKRNYFLQISCDPLCDIGLQGLRCNFKSSHVLIFVHHCR